MSTIDATWFAERATAASWSHALLVQPAIEDADAATADEDWPTCLLACLFAVERLVFCELLLAGRPASPREADLLLGAVGFDTPATAGLLELHGLRRQAGAGVSRSVAAAAREVVRRVDEHVTGLLPIDVIAMRTPEGFYPSLRVAAELERLRGALGLAPFEWSWWTNLS